MIPIYLCDDNREELSLIKEILEKHILMESLDFRVEFAAITPRALLNVLPDIGQNAVYFLDIDLKDRMNGLKLAEEIRQKDPRAYLIFVTTHEEMALVTFRHKVEALEFIVKDEPDFAYHLIHCLHDIARKACQPTASHFHRLHFHLPDRELYLAPEEIYFLQTEGAHKLTIHTRDSIYTCHLDLNTAAQMWDGFYLCHKSVLVNPSHIRSLIKSSCRIELDNSAICACSIRRFPELMKLLKEKAL